MASEYELAVKIAGKIDSSLTNATGLTKRELRSIAMEAANSSTSFASQFTSAYDKITPGITNFENVAKKAMKGAAVAATAAGTAIAGIATYSINVGSSFESQMSTVKAITGATGDDFDALTQKAKDLGASTKYTATEVGEAMQYMGMAGWKTDQILAGISSVMDLASASGEDLGTVSDIVTDDMTAFGISLEGLSTDEAQAQVQHFSDVLAAMATNTNTDVSKMGDTFKYAGAVAGALGYSIDDVAVATGLMANSGIKADQAGTALRSLFTRLAKPTKESKDAMDKLGLSITNSDGSMKSFAELMQGMRKGFSGMTADQKAYYAAELAGQRGMSGLLAIVNASQSDFDKATDAVKNCSGATKEMAEIKLDNLQGDVDIFKSALEGLGIEIYDQAVTPLRSTVQSGTDVITMLNQKLTETGWVRQFMTTMSNDLPSVARIASSTASSVSKSFAPIKDFGGWCVKHPDAISSVLTGITSAYVVLKGGQGLAKIVSGFTALSGVLSSPVAAGILAVAAAIGGASGIAAAVTKAREALDKADLAKRFGDVSLSIDDLKEATKQILSSTNFDALDQFGDAADKVDQYKSQLTEATEELNKLNWKVSIGVELSDDEQQDYINAISQYISGMEDTLSQQQYTVHVGMQILFDDDDQEGRDLIDQTDTYFSGAESKLAAVGKRLQSYVNKAFDDGLLTIDESKHISRLQQQMADIENALTQSSFQAKIQAARLDMSGQGLTPESFANLQNEISGYIDDAQQKYATAREESLSALASQYAEGGFDSKDDYQAAVQKVQDAYVQRLSDLQSQGASFELNTIYDTYGTDISRVAQQYSDQIDQVMDQYANEDMRFWWENNQDGQVFNAMVNDIGNSGLSQQAKDNINALLEQMQPTIDQMQTLKEQCEAAGQEVPESIAKGLEDVQNLKALTGDTDAIKQEIGERLSNHPELDNMLKETGNKMPEQIANGMKQNTDAVDDSVKQIWSGAQDKLQSLANDGIDVNTNVRIHANINAPSSYEMSGIMYGFSSGQRSEGSSSSKSSKTPTKHAEGGILTTPHLGLVAEAGPEAVIPLTKPARALQLYQQVGEILGVAVPSQTTENRSSITDASSMLYELNKQDISSYTAGNIGGDSYSSAMTTVAEAGPEAVIPLSRPARAQKILQQTEQILGRSVTADQLPTQVTIPETGDGTTLGDVLSDLLTVPPKDQITELVESGETGSSEAGSTTENSARIEYHPTLNFYTQGTPSRQDVEAAERMSQAEFEKMLNRYLKNRSRFSF